MRCICRVAFPPAGSMLAGNLMHSYGTDHRLPGVVSGFGRGILMSAVGIALCSLPVAAQGIAEGGSPLYLTAVRESLAGLVKGGGESAQEQGEVCPDCGKVHPKVQTQTQSADQLSQMVAKAVAQTIERAVGPVATAQGEVCEVCGQVHARGQSANAHANQAVGRQGSSVGAGAVGQGLYYYCANCKVYHRRPAASPQLPVELGEGSFGTVRSLSTNGPAGAR